MNGKPLALIGMLLLALGVIIASVLSQTGERWRVDEAKTFFNPGGNATAKLLAGESAKAVSFGGKNILLPPYASEGSIQRMRDDPAFWSALEADEPVALYSGPYGRAVITSYSGDRLAALADEPLIRDALEGRAAGVAGASAIAPDDARLFYAQAAGGAQIPILGASDMDEGTFAYMVGTKEFQRAVIESQRAGGKRLLLYQDPLSGQRALIPTGFSSSELRALQASDAVKQALALQQVAPGMAVDVSATPPWSGVDVAGLPAHPQTPLPIPFNPLASLSLPTNALVIPVAASAILGLIYFLAGRLARQAPAYPRARRRRGAHVTELEVAKGAGVSGRKVWGEAGGTIRLEPIFRIRIIDNILAEEGRVTIGVENESGKRIEGLSLFSGAEETHVGMLEPGEERRVSFSPQLGKEADVARLFLRFSPIMIEGRVYSRFEFSLPIQRL